MFYYQLDPAFIEDTFIDFEDKLRWNNSRLDDIK